MKARSAGAILTLLLLSAGAVGPANAQQQKPPTEALPPPHPAIEQAALGILKATTQRLADAKTLSFTAVTTYESPARDGQPLYYTTLSQVAVSRPNELRVITPGDGPASDFYYDGKTIIAYAPAANLVAVADAPSTIEAAMKAAYNKAAIYFPFAEVITDDAYTNLSERLTHAFVVGQSHVVDGVVTDMVAISNANIQAEIWIGVDDGLPRMIRAIYPKDPTDSRYEIEFTHWRLNVPFRSSDFTSAIALKAPRMQFARPDSPPLAKP
jgi:hypothetical protein